MKTVLIIVISILLAASAGLLCYGVTLGAENDYLPERIGVFVAPPDTIFMEGETPYDLSALLVKKTTPVQAADALLAVTYNSLMAERYFFTCRVEATSGSKFSCSDYFRIMQCGEDYFYQALSHSEGKITLNNSVFHSAIGLTRMDASGSAGFDTKSRSFSGFSYGTLKVKDANPGAFSRTPGRLFGLFGLPLNFEKKGGGVDYSVMTGATVKVALPTEEMPYYTLQITLAPNAVNASSATIDDLNDGTGGKMKNITVHSLELRFDIWESGLFRAIRVNSELTATVGGRTGQTILSRDYGFSYDKDSASILKHIKKAGWEKNVKPADLEMLKAREAAY